MHQSPLPLALPAQGATEPLAMGSLEMEFLMGFAQPALGAGTSCLPLPQGCVHPGLLNQVWAPACPSRQEKVVAAAWIFGEQWKWVEGFCSASFWSVQ